MTPIAPNIPYSASFFVHTLYNGTRVSGFTINALTIATLSLAENFTVKLTLSLLSRSAVVTVQEIILPSELYAARKYCTEISSSVLFVKTTVSETAVLSEDLKAYSATTFEVIPMLTSVCGGGTGIHSFQTVSYPAFSYFTRHQPSGTSQAYRPSDCLTNLF